MKNSYKTYVFSSLVISAVFYILSLLLVYIVDPAGLNNKFDLGLVRYIDFASRTHKFIEIDKEQPDTIMFGGSRIFYLATKDVEKYTNDKVYNMALSSSTMEEQYYFLEYAVKNHDIKNIVFGINLYPFSEELSKSLTSDFDKEIFETGFTLSRKIEHYLGVSLFRYVIKLLKTGYDKPFYENGSRTMNFQESVIAGKSWDDRKSMASYLKLYRDYLVWGETRIALFKKMVELCKSNGIDFKVFTTAMHVSQFEILRRTNRLDVYYKWKREIANVAPYFDFMYPNSVTRNEENFIDISHLRQEKGYLYFARIFEDNRIDVPEDFGVLVNKKNIETHISKLKNLIEK